MADTRRAPWSTEPPAARVVATHDKEKELKTGGLEAKAPRREISPIPIAAARSYAVPANGER